MSAELLGILTAVTGGLGTGVVVASLIIKNVAKDWVKWRERVEQKIDKLQPEHIMRLEGFDPARLSDHYEKVIQLGQKAIECKLEIDRVGEECRDHESRIRRLETERRA